MQHFHSAVELFSDIKCWPSSELDRSKRPKEDTDVIREDPESSPHPAQQEPPPYNGKESVLYKRYESQKNERISTAERQRLTNRNNRQTIFRSRGFDDPESSPTETKPYLVSCLLQDHIFNEGLCNFQMNNNLEESPSGPLHETPSAIIAKLTDDLDAYDDGSSCLPESHDEKSPSIHHCPIDDASSPDTVELALFDDERLDYEYNDYLIIKLHNLQRMRKGQQEKLRGRKLKVLRYQSSLLLSDNVISKKVDSILSRANKRNGSPRSVAEVHISIPEA